MRPGERSRKGMSNERPDRARFPARLWREILLTLAHSLWQGAAIALVLAIILSRVAGNLTTARYLASLSSLTALVISCLVTWSILDLPTPQSVSGETVLDSLQR